MSHAVGHSRILIRAACPADEPALERLAGRDSREVPKGPLLVAEAGGELRAALSLRDGAIVADPFHRTTELVDMLKIRAAGARAVRPGRAGRFERARPRTAFRTAG